MPSLHPSAPTTTSTARRDAPLELVMYGDFQCPFCTAAQPILRRVRDRLGGRLRFAFRHFPLDEVHPDAQRAAEASEAAAAQGAFWPMHDALYGLRGQLALEDIAARARGTIPGLDAERMRAELEAGAHAARVDADVDERHGARGRRDADVLRQRRPPHRRVRRPVADRRARAAGAPQASSSSSSSLSSPR